MTLVASAMTTAGTPINQDVAAPSVRIHQMRENSSPRDKITDQRAFAFSDFIYLNLSRRQNGSPKALALSCCLMI